MTEEIDKEYNYKEESTIGKPQKKKQDKFDRFIQRASDDYQMRSGRNEVAGITELGVDIDRCLVDGEL